MSDPVPPLTPYPPGRPPGAEVPAKYSNFFVISVSPLMVRLNFAEAFGSPESAVFHTAISLLPADAIALAQTILNQLSQVPPPAQDAEAASSSKPGPEQGDGS